MPTPLTSPQLAAIEAAIRSVIPGVKDTSPVQVRITESDDVNGLQNSWSGPAQSLAVRINDRLRADAERARAEGRAQVIAELRTRATGPMLLRVLDEVAEMFASHPEPMHQPYCVAATQGCCSCEEPTAPACSCRAEAVHQAGCDTGQHA